MKKNLSTYMLTELSVSGAATIPVDETTLLLGLAIALSVQSNSSRPNSNPKTECTLFELHHFPRLKLNDHTKNAPKFLSISLIIHLLLLKHSLIIVVIFLLNLLTLFN